MIFAVTESTFNLYKHFGCMILLMVVSTRKDCRVIWPKHGDQEKLAQLTQEREPLLDGMWGFVDGLNLQIRNPGDDDVQNAYYNGWLGSWVHGSVGSNHLEEGGRLDWIFQWKLPRILA